MVKLLSEYFVMVNMERHLKIQTKIVDKIMLKS